MMRFWTKILLVEKQRRGCLLLKRVDKQTDSRVICLDIDPKRERKKNGSSFGTSIEIESADLDQPGRRLPGAYD